VEYRYYDRFINKRTRVRYDVTPLFRNPDVFTNLVEDLFRPFRKKGVEVIVGIDALGFVLAGAIAAKQRLPLAVVRKEGKLPGVKETVIRTSFVDYTKKKKTLEMARGVIRKGDRVLIVDEWIETGAQVKAAIRLVERQGGIVVGISVLNADRNKRTKFLFDNYFCYGINLQ
jgi:adenine phosphoribosyltransferase